MSESHSRARVLFCSEAVTLAHLARPLVLAQSLDRSAYSVQFAVAPRYSQLIDDAALDCRPINSIPGEQFLQALARGAPLYDADTLAGYVREDLELIEAFKPDVVVGDFRLSLAVSARVANVPYITLTNISWSPFAVQRYTVPELPVTRLLGPTLAQWIFSLVRPLSFAMHTRPMHKVAKEFGVPSLGWDLCRVYTEADYTLYVDIPGMVATRPLPPEHQYIGAILWSPPVPNPPWWDSLPEDRPIIYLTLGSSGEVDILPLILSVLGGMNVSVMVATAGRALAMDIPENVYIADYLSGLEALERASLIICNGGSAPTQQALSLGVPVLGLPSNMDQFMNMGSIVRRGAGLLLRIGHLDESRLMAAVNELTCSSGYRDSAQVLAGEYAKYSSATLFHGVLEKAINRDA